MVWLKHTLPAASRAQNFKFVIPTLEQWLDGTRKVEVSYTGITNTTSISTETTRNGRKYCYHPFFLYRVRERNSNDLSKLIDHYIRDCQEAIEAKKREEESKNNKENAKLAHVAKLNQLFGCLVVVKEEWVSNHYARGAEPRGYTETRYYLSITNGNKETRELRIAEYSSSWSLSGLGSLSVEQVKEIINILIK